MWPKKRFKGVLYYHNPDEDLSELHDLAIVFGILLCIWWGIVHTLDWLTFDIVPWWAEILSFFALLPVVMTVVEYGKNPLLWWPMFWGTKIIIDYNELIYLDEEKLIKKWGGPYNVYLGLDWNSEHYIKFRRRRDAVFYSLKTMRN